MATRFKSKNPGTVSTILLAIVLSMLGSDLLAQFPIADFKFFKLGEEDGLNGVKFNDFIYKDSRGYTWISSSINVNRYNGVNFCSFTPSNSSLPEGYIQSNFHEDPSGHIWFAKQNYLVQYDWEVNDFIAYQPHLLDSNLVAGTYQIMFLDSINRTLWISKGRKVFTLKLDRPSAMPNIVDGLDDIGVRALVKANYGQVDTIITWYYMEPGLKIYYLDKEKKWQYHTFFSSAEDSYEIGPIRIYQALQNTSQDLTLLSEKGLVFFQPSTPNSPLLLSFNDCPCLNSRYGLQLSDSLLLLSSKEQGLCLFDSKTKEVTKQWKYNKDDETSLTSNNPKNLYWDRDSVLWIGHRNQGLNYAILEDQYFSDPLGIYNQSPTYVTSVVQDTQGIIWVATRDQGVFLFDDQQNLLGSYLYDDPALQLIKFEKIIDLSVDHKGHIWAINDDRVFRKKAGHTWEEVAHISSSKLQSIFHSASKDRTIIASYDAIIQLIQDSNGRFQKVPIADFFSSKGFSFQQIFQHSNGDLLIPYAANQLWVVSQEGTDFNRKKVISDLGIIFDIFELPTDSSLLLATDKGLIKLGHLDHSEPTKEMLYADPWKIGSNAVFQIERDIEGALWLSANNGLWRIHDNGQTEHFTENTGLQNSTFSFFAALKTGKGSMWFGNADGITVFDPLKVKLQKTRSYLQYQEFKINNELKEGSETCQIIKLDSIHLRSREKNFSFRVSAIGNQKSESTRILFKLTGYNPDWEMLENGGEVKIYNVLPGNHKLYIKAVGPSGDEAINVIPVKVESPFTQTWGFYLLLSLVTISTLILTSLLYARIKLKKQREFLLQERIKKEERDRIARELHDDLGTNLSEIQYTAEGLIYNGISEEDYEDLNRIYKYSKQSLSNMQDIIYILNTSNDSLKNLLSYLKRESGEYFKKHPTKLSITFPTEIPAVELGSEMRRNLLLIVKEGLHNIIKYAKADNAWLQMRIVNSSLVVTIKDDGIGFEVDSYLSNYNSGNGIKNLRKRTQDLNGQLRLESKVGEGTCIEVKFLIPKLSLKKQNSITKVTWQLIKSLLNFIPKAKK